MASGQSLYDDAAMTSLPALRRSRLLLVPLTNILVIALSYTCAFLLRFDFTIPEVHARTFLVTLPAAIIIHYLGLQAFTLTRGWWRYVSVSDFLNAVRASGAGTLCFAAYVYLFHRGSFFPRSVFLLNFVMLVGFSIGGRLAVRLWRQRSKPRPTTGRKRLLVIGAGDTAEALLREIRHSGRLAYMPLAIVDDDPEKQGMYLGGVRVVGPVSSLPQVVRQHAIDEIIIATPSASGPEMRQIIEICRAAGLPFKVMPATWELLNGKSLSTPRQVEINDLLRRPPVALDMLSIGRFLAHKRVLVTGAGGSIGAEICRQVLDFQPKASLVAVDHDENALFLLERSLSSVYDRPGALHFRLGDVTDHGFMDNLFSEYRPQVVFHAAAHKHVGVLEGNLIEGIRNNVLGTHTVSTLAGRHGSEAFVLISTDKAVNPSSVMGTTKRIAELLIETMPFATRYTAVRFGNVLGSQGSVVPLLKEQIARGGPVTITHPEMRRFFMTIPEAVELVIQAGSMGKENEIFMLDMGEPVKIVDLAEDLIRLSGLEPGTDIKIVCTGIRPGEKLSEELHLDSEQVETTTHSKIFVVRRDPCDREQFAGQLEQLRRAVDKQDENQARRLLMAMVPEYRPATLPTDAAVPMPAAQTALGSSFRPPQPVG
jgi:FlaA1/EpsC-like NDP-sugar epimerase